MSPRTARRLVRLYPRAWRARYEDEFVALVEARDSRWLDAADIMRGAVREWLRVTWIERGFAIGLDAWLTAVVTALVIAWVDSLVKEVWRFITGLEPILTLPVPSLALVKSSVLEMPVAMLLAAAMMAPWLYLTRVSGHAIRSPVTVRVIALVPVFAVCWVFGFSAAQFNGMMLAAWLVTEDIVSPKAKMVAS